MPIGASRDQETVLSEAIDAARTFAGANQGLHRHRRRFEGARKFFRLRHDRGRAPADTGVARDVAG